MNVIHSAAELQHGSPKKVSAAIGVFDGVHLGHQQVIGQTIEKARQESGISVVITFDRHPSSVLSHQHAPPLIYPLEKRLEVIETLGADTVYLIRFDKEFSKITGEQFIRDLCCNFKRLDHVCVGHDFSFGCGRGGNVQLLEKLGRELHFSVQGLSHWLFEGQTVSSTRIREAIRLGAFTTASQMLGRPYTLVGKVVEGDHLGRQLGFPTANLDSIQLALPPTGVYAARVVFGEKNSSAVVNIGRRPTLKFPTPRLQIEAHLLDFNGDLYGRTLELRFLEKLRDEQRFPSLDALKTQINADISKARILESNPIP